MNPAACKTCGNATHAGPGALCPACLIRLALDPSASSPEYQIAAPLGTGPGGASFAAQEIGSNRLLAVKVIALDGGTADPARVEQLRAALMGFHHERVAETFAMEETRGELRLVRAFVRGRPLASWLGGRTGAVRRAAVERIREAVAAIHEAGLAHGNLTETNIIVDSEDAPVIVDLGAHLARGSASAAEDQVALGELESRWIAP